MSEPDAKPAAPRPPPRGFLGATFGAYFARLPWMFGLGALVSLPHALMVWLSADAVPFRWWTYIGFELVRLVGVGLVTGLVLHDLAGDRCSLFRMARRAARRLPAMAVASLLPFAALAGMFWLGINAARHAGPLAPVVIITTLVILAGLSSSWRLAVTAAFVEGRGGTASIARSMTLTRGRRLRIFLAEFALAILISPLTSVLSRLEPGSTNYLLAELAVQGVVIGMTATFAAIVYAQLRHRHDGCAPQAITAVLAH